MRNVKILAWDHNLDHMDSSVDVIYSDKAASRYIWGTAFHWYSNGATQNLSMHHDAWPDKPLLSTEGCQGLGSNSSGLETGEIYGTAIIDDLNRWSVGWVDWNMLLDTHGGPNHAGNFCGAPILADTQNDKLFFQSSYYYLGQFARFIRPGAKVILCSSSDSRLTATAGLNQDGTVALVVMNHSDDVMQFNVASADTSTPVSLPPHSIATFLINSRDL
jgi:glucosylceramidase